MKTLAYFDIFSYPLTRQELIALRWHDEGGEKYQIEYKNGYFALHDIDAAIEKREHRVWMVEQRKKIAQRAARKLRFVPFVMAVFVCNQLQITVKEESDIDVFVIIKAGRLWCARLMVTALLCVFGMRRNSQRVDKHVCLSFYVTDDALNLKILEKEEDIYLAYWVALLMPIYDPESLHTKIIKENTELLNTVPNHARLVFDHPRLLVPNSLVSGAIKKFGEWMLSASLGDFVEKKAKRFQKNKMRHNYQSRQGEGTTDVIISDQMLKFHENDRREYFRDEWHNRVAECKVGE